MTSLIDKKKNYFAKKITILRQKLVSFEANNELSPLEQFENQLMLKELEACFLTSNPEELGTKLIHLLSQRWERIVNSSICYTYKPSNPVNQLCLELAKALAQALTPELKIEENLEFTPGPYHLMMPSLELCNDVSGQNVHELNLDNFILSDNKRRFIPLADCLLDASVSDEGQLRHMVAIEGLCPNLTPCEVLRVSRHSEQAAAFYQAVMALNQHRLLGNHIGVKLSLLAAALRKGNSYGGSGTSSNAGSQANEGIVAFSDYWNTLTKQQQSIIFSQTPGLEEIIARLFRPQDTEYQAVRFCVNLLAEALEPIIRTYTRTPSLKALKQAVLKQSNDFLAAAKRPGGLKINPRTNPPRNMSQIIFKLDSSEQIKLFERLNRHELISVLKDTLLHPELQVHEALKQLIITKKEPCGHSVLFHAVESGIIDLIELLLRWGADFEVQDTQHNRPIHWAVNKGFVSAVRCLLDNGALLEARGNNGNTALNCAVIGGNRTLVKLLLEKNASTNARNAQRNNALDLAIAHHPELIAPLLLNLCARPIEEQAESLFKLSPLPYQNVLFYTALRKPFLFEALLDKTLEEQPSILFHTSPYSGMTLLILAAKLGFHVSIGKLLDLGLELEAQDFNQDRALHWAARYGRIEIVRYLLDKNALLEAKGYNNVTGLMQAVLCGNEALVTLLLEKNALINPRNDQGMNALDLAIAQQPELVEPLLIHLATQDFKEQAECLLNVPDGPYANVLSYAARHKPFLFEQLIEQPTSMIQNAFAAFQGEYPDYLLKKLVRLSRNKQAECLHPYDSVRSYVLDKRPDLLINLFDEIGIEQREEYISLKILELEEHIQCMIRRYRLMRITVQSNSNYSDAVAATKTLLNQCIKAKIVLHQEHSSSDDPFIVFKNTCTQAINAAKPVLGTHREWAKVFAAFLATLLTLPFALPLYACGFFSVKTKSEQLLDKLQLKVNELQNF